jgi:hypothetical protein
MSLVGLLSKVALLLSVVRGAEFCGSGDVADRDAYMLEASWGDTSQVSEHVRMQGVNVGLPFWGSMYFHDRYQCMPAHSCTTRVRSWSLSLYLRLMKRMHGQYK